MISPRKKLKIGVYLDNHGGHAAGWRMPSVNPHEITRLGYWKNLARLCEDGKLDYLFFADANRVLYLGNEAALSQVPATPFFEPLTLLSALADHTTNLGLVATMTTTYSQPYSVARLFGSLDHISEGRASWNVVTSSSSEEAPNFQAERHMSHDDRYGRAREFLKIVCGLWDSWEDDAFIRDQDAGVYLDPEKMHYLNHRSEHFSVRGPLNLPRPPQGRPVIFQAGSSEIGREFGAEMADALFTAQHSKEASRAFCNDVRGRMVRHGRNPEDLVVFVGVSPIVGSTFKEAQAKYDQLQSKLTPDVALQLLSEVLAVDMTKYPPNELVTDLPPSDGMQSRRDLLLAKALKEKLTLLELARQVAGGRGHRQIIGTPEMIADDFQEWLEEGATDGFLLAPAYLPGALEDFVTLVVPELQRRGIFRTQYEGATLRENLGLPQPAFKPARLHTQAPAGE